jgi:group I intron endonuclease
MKGSGIYKIQSISHPERFYIGSTCHFKKRKNNHFILLRKNKHHSIKLQNNYNKYGESDLVFKIIELCLPDYLVAIEDTYLKPLPYFNINPKADSCRGVKRSAESNENNRQKHLGKKMTGEQRLAMIKAVTGLKRSEENKRKLRGNKNSLGHKHTEETRKKMSVSHTGTQKSAEVRYKMSESGKKGWEKRRLKYQYNAICKN